MNKEIKRIPIVTIVLLVLYLVVFVFIQHLKPSYEITERNYFFNQELDKYYFPLYMRYMQKHASYTEYWDRINALKIKTVTREQIYDWIRSDPFFLIWIKNRPEVISKIESKKPDSFRRFNFIKNNNAFEKYSFKPFILEWHKIIYSIFLQDNFFSFILTVLLIGFSGSIVEYKFGGRPLLGLFVAGAISSVAFIGLIMPMLSIGISLGLSISCFIFGVYCILRTRRMILGCGVLALLSCLYYFKYIQGYATLLAGILLCYGVLLGYMYQGLSKFWKNKCNRYDKKNSLEYQLKNSKNLLESYQIEAAKQNLIRLLEQNPDSNEVKFLLYHCLKNTSSTRLFHKIANLCLSIPDKSHSILTKQNIVFRDYKSRAIPYPKWDIQVLVKLMQKFRKSGYVQDADWILGYLTLHYREILYDTLAHEHILLARKFQSLSDHQKSYDLNDKCASLFPKTTWGLHAKELVSTKFLNSYSGGL